MPHLGRIVCPLLALGLLLPSMARSEDKDGNRILVLQFQDDVVTRAGQLRLVIDGDEGTVPVRFGDSIADDGDSFEDDIVPRLVDLVNAGSEFADSAYLAEVDPANPKRIVFRQKNPKGKVVIRAFGLRPESEDGRLCIRYSFTEDPPETMLALVFPALLAEGAACDSTAPSTVSFFLNSERIDLEPDSGDTEDTILADLLTILAQRGFQTTLTGKTVIFEALPDGTPIRRLGFGSDDAGVLAGAPTLFETTRLSVPALTGAGFAVLVSALLLAALWFLHRQAGAR